jgi:hypothetical protein
MESGASNDRSILGNLQAIESMKDIRNIGTTGSSLRFPLFIYLMALVRIPSTRYRHIGVFKR